MLPLRDIMTMEIVTVSPETSIREAMELLVRRHVSGAPVVSGEQIVGIVSTTDLMTFAGSEIDTAEDHDVSDVMTRPPLAALPLDTDVQVAAELMRRRGVHRVLVVDGDQLVGIVSSLDIANAGCAAPRR